MNKLSPQIAAYVAAANAQDGQRIAHCFTPDAVVHDEGHVHRGRTEIAAWAHDTSMRYRATMEAASVEETGDKSTLRALVRGDFPGSPVTLAFHFTLAPEGIAALEVTP